MRKLICILMIFALLAGSAYALTGEWDAIARIKGSESSYLVRKDGLWGMVDKEGKVIIKPVYNTEPEFIGGYAVISVPDSEPREGLSGETVYGSFYGIISDAGEIVLEPEYENLTRTGDGSMVRYELGDTYHFLNLETGKKLPGSYDRAGDFMGDYVAVAMKGAQVDKNLSAPEVMHWGTIDRNGKTGIQLGYDSIEVFEDGTAIVKLADKYGYMHADGREITRCRYDIARPFQNGRALVAVITGEGNLDESELYVYGWGAIDIHGEEIVPLIYDEPEQVDTHNVED